MSARRVAVAGALFSLALPACLEPGFEVVELGLDSDLRNVAFVGGEVLAVGDGGRVVGFDAQGELVDGSTTAQVRGRPVDLLAITPRPEGGLLISGQAGVVLERAAGEADLRRAPTPATSASLRVLLRPDPDTAWAAGDDGAFLVRSAEGRWSSRDLGSVRLAADERIAGGWAEDGAAVLVTDRGNIVERRGADEAWRLSYAATATVATGTISEARSVPLFSAWASAPEGERWAVGGQGTVLHRPAGAATWAPLDAGVTEDLYAVTGDGAGGIVAVGARGTVLEGDAAGLARSDPGLARDLFGVASRDGRVIAVGARGAWVERN